MEAGSGLLAAGWPGQWLSGFVDIDIGRRAVPHDFQDNRLVLGAIPMHGVGNILNQSAGRKGIGLAGIKHVAGADPPMSRKHGYVAGFLVEMGSRHIAGQPFQQKCVRAWLIDVAEQRVDLRALTGLFAAGLPFDVLRQDEGDVRGIG